MAFKDSFAAARKSGKKTFTFEGKSYNTKLASTPATPKKGPVPAPRPSAGATASSTSGASRSTSGKVSATSGASRSTSGKASATSGASRSTSGKTPDTSKGPKSRTGQPMKGPIAEITGAISKSTAAFRENAKKTDESLGKQKKK